ncbi:MAG: hypothetical protein HBSAPP02_28530 [Phycisphaerae bacterium]|nr:MAG: hypothetical protein HBSAPP02_28530 [Phycisphaerae bacterium]
MTTTNDATRDIRNLPAGTLMVSTLDGEPGRVVEPATRSRNGKNATAYVVLTHDGREIWEAADIILPDPDPKNAAILNPRVMAAAADLFAACQAVEALWRKHGLGDDDAESEPVWNQLRRAIAKAEGRNE